MKITEKQKVITGSSLLALSVIFIAFGANFIWGIGSAFIAAGITTLLIACGVFLSLAD